VLAALQTPQLRARRLHPLSVESWSPRPAGLKPWAREWSLGHGDGAPATPEGGAVVESSLPGAGKAVAFAPTLVTIGTLAHLSSQQVHVSL
jgi:hypothetical protein